MIPTRDMLQRVKENFRQHLIALHAISPLQVVPVGIALTPNSAMVPEDVPTSDFTTAFGPRVLVAPIFQSGRDPVTDEYVLAFTFATAGPDHQLIDTSDNPVPRTVHGYAMKTTADDLVVGAQRLPAPITYNQPLQIVQWGEVSFRYPASAIR